MSYTLDRCRNLLRTGRDRYEKVGERVPESINVGDWLVEYVEELRTNLDDTEHQSDQISDALGIARVELQEAREANEALRPWTIEDVDDLANLPNGAVLMGDGDAFQKSGGHFLHVADDQAWDVDELKEHGFWPLTLLYRGSWETEEEV